MSGYGSAPGARPVRALRSMARSVVAASEGQVLTQPVGSREAVPYSEPFAGERRRPGGRRSPAQACYPANDWMQRPWRPKVRGPARSRRNRRTAGIHRAAHRYAGSQGIRDRQALRPRSRSHGPASLPGNGRPGPAASPGRRRPGRAIHVEELSYAPGLYAFSEKSLRCKAFRARFSAPGTRPCRARAATAAPGPAQAAPSPATAPEDTIPDGRR